jgi:hypothetical protein
MHPLSLFTITVQSCSVRSSAERADTLPLFHLYPYVLCGLQACSCMYDLHVQACPRPRLRAQCALPVVHLPRLPEAVCKEKFKDGDPHRAGYWSTHLTVF